MKRSGLVLLSVLLLLAAFPAWAENPHCEQVSGVLMTNIGVIPFGSPGPTNLGPVFGDLKGSVAAEYKGNLTFQHYWVMTSGDTINFKLAVLNADPEDFLDNGNVVVVRLGHYKSEIAGGTGKYANAKGTLEYFGLADFGQQPLVLRYRGNVCSK
jgi:hypothetical protein